VNHIEQTNTSYSHSILSLSDVCHQIPSTT